MLYESLKTKRYILIGASAVILAVLTIVIFQKTRQKIAKPSPASVQKTIEEKQKEMSNTINEANKSSAQNQLPPKEQAERQQDMTDSINKANAEAPKISEEEEKKRQQDMLNVINEMNK